MLKNPGYRLIRFIELSITTMPEIPKALVPSKERYGQHLSGPL